MYKLLIVDDEPTVRAGLGAYFDWAAHGIEVIGEVDDGDVALERIGREAPDLILTDVRMPNMDGIALSRQVARLHPRSKIVFVSGHDDAEYLKSALQVSAVDYIFKPVNLQELGEVIQRVVASLDEDRAGRQREEEVRAKLKMSMPLLREKFLLSLVAGSAPKAILREQVDFLGLNLPDDASYWVLVVAVDDLAEVTGSRSEYDRQLLWYSVQNVCQELIDRHLGGYAIGSRDGEFVGILRREERGDEAPEAAEALLALAGDIRDNLQSYLKLGVTIGIGERADALSDLARGYRQAREAADHKWYMGKNRIITMDSLDRTEGDEGPPGLYGIGEVEQLTSALNAADTEKLRESLDRLFEGLHRNRRNGLKYARNACLQIALSASQLLMELNAMSPDSETEEERIWESLPESETLAEMRLLLEAHLSASCERIREKRAGKTAGVVERVRSVIEQKYSDGSLTVAEIGREVYLTPTYVSLLFKQETGQTVGEYLTQVRMDRAKEMLRDPQYKLYDICYAIGYTDPSYFTKLFKKTTGVTPSVYRENHA